MGGPAGKVQPFKLQPAKVGSRWIESGGNLEGGNLAGDALQSGGDPSVLDAKASQILGMPEPSTAPSSVEDPNAEHYALARKTAQDEETRRLRSGAGRASTILTGAGSSSPLGLARRTLGSA